VKTRIANKLYNLGKLLTEESLDEELVSLYKLSSGIMPGLDLVQNSPLFGSMLQGMDENIAEQWVGKFLDLNSAIFSIHTPVKRLGGGADGEAYLTDDSRVLKLFNEPKLMSFYQEETDKLYQGAATQSTIQIYDFGKFELPEQKGVDFLGWALTEYLPNQGGIGEDEFYRNIYDYITYNFDPDSIKEITSDNLAKAADIIYQGFIAFYPLEEVQPEGYDSPEGSKTVKNYIIALLYSMLQGRVDTLGSKNLGYRNETPVFFDPFSPGQNDADDLFGEMPQFDLIEQSEPLLKLSQNYTNPAAFIERFIDINSDIFTEYMPVESIGAGAHGHAYKLEDGRVFKIFGGLGALEEYKRLEDVPFDPETGDKRDLRVYDSGPFRMPDLPLSLDGREIKENMKEHFDLGWVVTEELKTPRKFLEPGFSPYQGKPTLDHLLGYVSDFARAMSKILSGSDEIPRSTSDEDIAKFLVDKRINHHFERWMKRPSRRKQYFSVERLRVAGIEHYGLEKSWIEDFMISNFKSLTRGHRDTKPENMGYRGTTPVFFDAYNPSPAYEAPEEYTEIRDWDKTAKLNRLKTILSSALGPIRRNLDYGARENFAYDETILTPELAKQYGLEHLLPQRVGEFGEYGKIFSAETVIGNLVGEMFSSFKGEKSRESKEIWVKDFLNRNADVLERYKPTNFLGSGSYADAWTTEDDRVIKLMSNDKDLDYYKEQAAAVHDPEKGSKYNLMVFDYGIFDVPLAKKPYDVKKLRNMSWVVIEKLNPIRSMVKSYDDQLKDLAKYLNIEDKEESNITKSLLREFKKAFGKLNVYFGGKRNSQNEVVVSGAFQRAPNKPGPDSDMKDIETFTNGLVGEFIGSSLYGEVMPVFKEAERRLSLPKGWLPDIVRSMIFQLISDNTDVHSGNLGYRGDTPVYFDPSNRHPKGITPSEFLPSDEDEDPSETIYLPEETWVYNEEEE